METLLVFAAFAVVCIWFIGNIAIGLRKQNSELVDKLVGLVEHASIRQLDREPVPELPGYIPMQDGTGGFYKQPDGQWVAELNGPVVNDGPFGGRETTTESVEGIFPTDVDVEEEA